MTVFYPIKNYSYPAFAIFFIVLVPIFIVLKNLKTQTNSNSNTIKNLLLLFLFEVLCYESLEFFVLSAPDFKTALGLQRIFYMLIPFMMPTYAHLVFSFPDKIIKKSFHIFLVFYFPPIIFSILSITTDLIIKDVQLDYWGYAKSEGFLFNLLRIHIISFFLLLLFATIRNIFKYRGEPKLRNLSLHLFSAIILPALFFVIVIIILPLFFNTRICHILTPSYGLGFMVIYLTYIIVSGHLLDFSSLVNPIFRTKKYYFHCELLKLMDEIQYADSIKLIIKQLSSLLKCSISVYARISGTNYFISSEKEEIDSAIAKYNFNENDIQDIIDKRQTQNQKIVDFFTEYEMERIFPIVHRHITGFIFFGKNFSRNIYSSKDVKLVDTLCERLKNIIFILYNNKSRMNSLLILANKGEVKSIVSDYHEKAMMIDLENFSERPIPALDIAAYFDLMEQMIRIPRLSKNMTSGLPSKIDDIVLVYYDESPTVFAKIENIEPAYEERKLFIVTLFFFVIPPVKDIWYLTHAHMNGSPFIIGDHVIKIMKLDAKPFADAKVIPISKKLRFKPKYNI